MKKLIVILSFAGMGCSTKQPNTSQTSRQEKLLIVQVVDYSKSIRINYFDSIAARHLYYIIARTGGCLKLIGVYDNSNMQDIYTLQITKLDTQSTKGVKNLFQVGRIKAHNERILGAFKKQAAIDLAEYVSEISRPCTGKYSDIAASLALAKTTLSEPVYNIAYKKALLICSDMLNDKEGSMYDKLEPVNLDNTQVIFIRPSLPIDTLQLLFPGSDVYSFTTSINAIQFLNQ